MAKGVRRERDQNIVHTMFTNTDSQGNVSYLTRPKQRETQLPRMGRALCTSPTALPLHACTEVFHGHPRVFRVTGGATLGMVRPAVKC